MTAEDDEKKYILKIINDATHPIKAPEIQALGGSKLEELIKESRSVSGDSDPDDIIKRNNLYKRQINRRCFQLASAGLVKEKDGKTDQALTGTFISLGSSYVSETSATEPAPRVKRAPKSVDIKPKSKRKDLTSPSEITDEIIISSWNDVLSDGEADKNIISKELLNIPSRFKVLTESIIKSQGIEASQDNINIVYSAILIFASSRFLGSDFVSASYMTDHDIDTKDLTKGYIKSLIETNSTTKLKTLSKNLLDVSGFSNSNTHTINTAQVALRLYVAPITSSSETELEPSPTPEPTPEEKPISLSDIDSRIDLSATTGLEERISSKSLTKSDEELLSNMIPLAMSLDSLVTYIHESKDYFELAPIMLRFDRDNKLPYHLWEAIRRHKSTGTMLEASREMLPVFLKLKSVVLRLDKIKDESDYISIAKIFMNFPKIADSPIHHTEILRVERYFSTLSSYPVSSPNKERIAKKISLLRSIHLNESESRIVANNEAVMNADMLQIPNEILIDDLLYTNKKSLPSDTLSFGPQYTLVELSTPVSKEEARLKSIASKIDGMFAPEVASQVKDLYDLSEDDYERAITMFDSGKHTGYEEGFIYLNHRNLIDSIIYKQIENLIKKS